MKKIIKRVVVLTLLVLISISLFACNEKTTTTFDADNLSGSITVWWPGGSDTIQKAVLDAKANYEREHAKCTINIKFQSTPDFYASYTMALMGKEFPDAAYVDHVYVQRLAFDGLTKSLSELGLNNLEDSYVSSLWKPNLYEGELYALPMSANILALTYNKSLLTKVYGREFVDDDLPKNWEEYIAIGARIKQYNIDNNLTGNDSLYLTTVPAGTGAESMGAMYFLAYSARSGGTIMNEELTEMTLSSQANIDASTKIKYLADNGYTTTTFSESKFETGKIAFIEMGPWKFIDYSRIDEASEDMDYGWTTVMPFTEDGDTSSTLGLYSLVLTKKSKNPALAADFMKYVSSNTEIQVAHNSVQNLMPVTKEALKDEFYQTADWETIISQLNNTVARPGSAAWPTIEKYIAEYVTGLVNGTRDVNYIYSLQAALTEKLEDLEDE